MSEPGPVRQAIRERLGQSAACGRVHGAYLFAGPGEAPRETALWFARALVCQQEGAAAPCEDCSACRRSQPGEPIPLDGSGRKGPLLRHVGDHPDLLWVERGADDTRVRIGQVRAVQSAFRLRGPQGGRRVAVIADADWLNQEAQNALLRLLEEPPAGSHLILLARSPAALLATVRSRCQRIVFPAERAPAPGSPQAPEEQRALAARLCGLPEAGIPGLLDWAQEYRGARAVAAAEVNQLLAVASAWLHERICGSLGQPGASPQAELHAFGVLQRCRKGLAQRNANPQMVAERALLALRLALRP